MVFWIGLEENMPKHDNKIVIIILQLVLVLKKIFKLNLREIHQNASGVCSKYNRHRTVCCPLLNLP